MKSANNDLNKRINELEVEIVRCKDREQAIHNASKTISSDISLDKVLQNIVLEITETLSCSGCTVSIWHSDRNMLETMVDFSRDYPDEVDQPGSLYELDEFPKSRYVLETGQTAIIQHDDLGEDDAELVLMNEWEMLTLVMTPLIAKDQVIGMVELYEEVKPRIFSKEEINLVESLASQAAISIRNSQLYEQAQHEISVRKKAENQLKELLKEIKASHEELSTLYKISSTINESISMEDLLPGVLKAVTHFDIFDIERKGAIFLIEKERMNLAAHLDQDQYFLDSHENMKIGDCLCGLAAQTGKVVISSDSFTDQRHSVQYKGMEDHGHIIVPLKSPKGIEGVLCLYTNKNVTINERIQNLFQTIGIQVGTMVRNAKLYEEIRSLSLYDPLTGLANRRMMDIHLKKLLLNTKRDDKIFYILMLDVDNFKKYNDRFGHDAGDIILSKVASIFKKTIRESDLTARYGGEEFLIAISETRDDIIWSIADRIREQVEDETDVTISIGISQFRRGLELNELIKEADTALYKAKQLGRNRCHFSDFEENQS